MDKWIFLLKVRSRPGVLSALTSVFADRGVSIESLTAQDGSLGTPLGTAILTFRASAPKKDHLARLLGRLATVAEVIEYRYDDAAHARKSALVRVTLSADDLVATLPPGILCDIVSAAETETLALLLGSPRLLDDTLTSLADRQLLRDMNSTVIVVQSNEENTGQNVAEKNVAERVEAGVQEMLP